MRAMLTASWPNMWRTIVKGATHSCVDRPATPSGCRFSVPARSGTAGIIVVAALRFSLMAGMALGEGRPR
jgi:hypothetical protein